jgi:hypothetical protein
MRGSDNIATMADAIARFEAQVQRLALDIVQSVIRQELERVTAPLGRGGKLELSRPGKRGPKPKPAAVRPPKRKSGRAERVPQLELQLARAAERQLDLDLPRDKRAAAAGRDAQATPAPAPPVEAASPAPVASPASAANGAPRPVPAAPAPAATASPPAGRKRTQWTREAIVHELASWMSKGTAIDAQFMTRHGPRGLVAATRRIFGRFDAALNVAALHISKMQPDEPSTSELS